MGLDGTCGGLLTGSGGLGRSSGLGLLMSLTDVIGGAWGVGLGITESIIGVGAQHICDLTSDGDTCLAFDDLEPAGDISWDNQADLLHIGFSSHDESVWFT